MTEAIFWSFSPWGGSSFLSCIQKPRKTALISFTITLSPPHQILFLPIYFEGGSLDVSVESLLEIQSLSKFYLWVILGKKSTFKTFFKDFLDQKDSESIHLHVSFAAASGIFIPTEHDLTPCFTVSGSVGLSHCCIWGCSFKWNTHYCKGQKPFEG